METVKAVPKRLVFSPTIHRDLQLVQALPRHGQADQAAAVAGHEIDRFRGHHGGRDGQIALVFTVLIIDYDDHAPFADILYRLFDTAESQYSPLQ